MILFLNVLICGKREGIPPGTFFLRGAGELDPDLTFLFFFFLRGKESKPSTSVAFSTFLHMQTPVGGCRAAKVRFVILGNLPSSRTSKYFSAPGVACGLETESALQCV